MYQLSQVCEKGSSEVRGDLGGDYGEGVVGARSGGDVIRMFPGARLALQQFYEGKLGEDTRIAAASSADTPLAVKIGRSAMDLIEVVPGVTVREVFAMGWPEGFEGNLQIGRSPPLSSNKAKSHFPILRAETGIDYDGMLYFDDASWDRHDLIVAAECPGVVAIRTPEGLQPYHWEDGLKKYAAQAARSGAAGN